MTARVLAVTFLVCLAVSPPATAAEPGRGYAVVVSRATHEDAAWKPVVEALVAKHRGTVIIYDKLPDARAGLSKQMPRYACFVVTPAEATKAFVEQVHRLTRQLDDDPYTDVIWGILTGYDADNALRIAKQTAPLEVRRVAAGTEVALDHCDEGVWYSELKAGRIVRKKADHPPAGETGSADTTKALADTLSEYKADLFVTSGHATERDWQIGFAYRNGSFRSAAGKLFGVDTRGKKVPIESPNPKVYLAVGNCLMGHISGPDAMALAFLNSAGVHQMVGYTDLTWFGYGGWGMLDYFVEQPGRFTLAEAFFANHQALLHKLETEFPADARKESAGRTRNGLLYDRDIVAFYGDPAWDARMKPAARAWEQELTETGGTYTLTITPKQGAKTFEPVNTNGSQRGGRPVVAFLPHRVANVKVTAGADLKPVVTDDFVLVPLPKAFDPNKTYRVTFTADRVR